MAKSFLEAVEENMPLYGKSPVTGKAKVRPPSDPSEGDPDDEEMLLADLMRREQEAALAEGAGGEVKDRPEDSTALGNSSTAMGNSAQDLYRITSGDEDVTEVTMADLMGQDPDALMGGGRAPEIETTPRGAMGNSSTAVMSPSADSRDLILSGAEGYSEVEGGSFSDGVKPRFDKSALLDPTMGARQAGIPEETLASYFKSTHGGSFDPKSKTDRAKMMAIQDMIQEDKSLLGLSPTKFALKVYSRK